MTPECSPLLGPLAKGPYCKRSVLPHLRFRACENDGLTRLAGHRGPGSGCSCAGCGQRLGAYLLLLDERICLMWHVWPLSGGGGIKFPKKPV